jgi:hypothetical protein
LSLFNKINVLSSSKEVHHLNSNILLINLSYILFDFFSKIQDSLKLSINLSTQNDSHSEFLDSIVQSLKTSIISQWTRVIYLTFILFLSFIILIQAANHQG